MPIPSRRREPHVTTLCTHNVVPAGSCSDIVSCVSVVPEVSVPQTYDTNTSKDGVELGSSSAVRASLRAMPTKKNSFAFCCLNARLSGEAFSSGG